MILLTYKDANILNVNKQQTNSFYSATFPKENFVVNTT